ncbi:MAG: hypothetical protein K2P94_09350 [Rhodospirillaceae bacterium]|nr:hypothetical protein [Rhodospirillaceae bacterium]
MFASQDFNLELKLAITIYLIMGILLSRRLDRRMAGSRVQLGDFVLGPIFLPLIVFLSELFEISRKAFRTIQTVLAFNPSDD